MAPANQRISRLCGSPRYRQDERLPIGWHRPPKVAIGIGSGLGRSPATLVPEMKTPDGGSTLWVFALPEK
jgi:hypothetical protein